MLSNQEAVQTVFDAVVPSFAGAKTDIITAMSVVIGFSLIGLAFYYVRSLFTVNYRDGVLRIDKRSAEDDINDEEFLFDEEEWYKLKKAGTDSDTFRGRIRNRKMSVLVNKWTDKTPRWKNPS